MPYDLLIYEGAAAHYRHRRPPYSPDLESVLARELELDGRGRLLDVGRGPGILTVRLAPLFEEAVGLDPDAAMLAAGQRAARELGRARGRRLHSVHEWLSSERAWPDARDAGWAIGVADWWKFDARRE